MKCKENQCDDDNENEEKSHVNGTRLSIGLSIDIKFFSIEFLQHLFFAT